MTSSSKLSTSSIQHIVDFLKDQCYRDSTKRNYYTVWEIFNKFYLRLDVKPMQWEDRLTLFIGYLIDNNRQSSTVKSYISAIKAVLKMDGVKITEDQYLISSLTKACRLRNDNICLRLPIGKNLLGLVIRNIRVYFEGKGQVYLSTLYSTLMSTAYFRLFRVGELTKGEHPVLARDVHIGKNKKKFLFILQTSKTHWKNSKPQTIKISSYPIVKFNSSKVKNNYDHSLPCPYGLLQQFANIRGPYRSLNEPFFVFADKTPVKP